MANEKERELVKAAYNSKHWREKVDRMPDSQVVAVYMRLRAQGKLK